MAHPEPDTLPASGNRKKWWWLAGAILVLGLYVTWFIVRPAYLAAKGKRLVELKNVAIGHLENEQEKTDGYAEAAKRFQALAEELPGEELGLRNLAICRLLDFQAKNKAALEEERAARDDAAAAVRQAIDQLRNDFDDSAATHWLDAQVALADLTAGPEAAVASFERAVDLDPENAVFWLALYEARSLAGDAGATDALKKAYELVPRNLYVLTEWLVVQAQTKDESLADTLQAADNGLQPLHTAILRRGTDLSELVSGATTAFEQKDWPTVLRNVRVLRNVIRPEEIAKSDAARVSGIHPLEFVIHDFSDQFYERYRPATPETIEPIAVKFEEISTAGLPLEGSVVDLALTDFNLDGNLDLVTLLESQLVVFSRSDDTWQPIAQITLSKSMSGILIGEIDRDGSPDAADPMSAGLSQDEFVATEACFESDPDIVLYGADGIMVLRNDQDTDAAEGSLTVIEQEGSCREVDSVVSAVLVDFDHDGDLDLVASTMTEIKLWRCVSEDSLKFEDASSWSILPSTKLPFTSLAIVDWDRDADIDVVLGSRDSGAAGYLENLRHGQFRYREFDDEFFGDASTQAIAVLEADGNASWDLVAAGEDGVRIATTTTPRSGVVQHLHTRTISEDAQAGLMLWDFDNDGLTDLTTWNERLQTLRAALGGDFSSFSDQDSPHVTACRSGDLDNDGDLDLAVIADHKLVLYDNVGGNKNNWIELRARGQNDNKGRANHYGIGGLAEIRAGALYRAQVITSQRTHFGLGQREKVDVARIVWTNGVPQNIIEPEQRQTICELMFLKGSCPYIYTWNGERYEFLTDCLWAAPLGLQFAEGVSAPSRPWEYLKIPGERLQPKDGEYVIQITEELWEAAYFDKVQLIAVDHPADVDVYSNEKVGPAAIAEFKVHTVREPHGPIAAHDQRGRDVLAKISVRDGDYLQAFDHKERQGLTEEHFLELDFGPLDDPRQITLFLTGWIHPTDTSLNIGFGQNPQRDGPRPPSVWVPDADGNWRETIAYMGFPGGKTKTIAVDLSEAFLTDDYRVRIKTTAEIYWDAAFVTFDEAPAETRLTHLQAESADLHFRGFSRRLPKRPRSPQVYDYDTVFDDVRWLPMRGQFTRYGDVTELLHETDDRMLIMGAGDEVTIRFAADESDVPLGWKRDFLLYSVGWDKDADLNTIYGQTVGPLPFEAMNSYPYQDGESYPDTPEHREYLRNYQTREQSYARFWRSLIRID